MDNIIKYVKWVLSIVSLLLVLFACIAPFVFTREAIITNVNFEETGQIGDTIGGTMGPFVALAAVLLTFLAFLMQVQANKIQKDQFFKSLKNKENEEKIKLRNTLELVTRDIDFTIDDIDKRTSVINEYCNYSQENPYFETGCKKISSLALTRYQTIDRNLLY